MTSFLFSNTSEGLYCSAGDFYVDPAVPVPTAIITHGHADHVAKGCQRYITSAESVELLIARGIDGDAVEGVRFGEQFKMGTAQVSFHPAGHILGSTQVRTEIGGRVAVYTGDFKLASDATCRPFEAVRCDELYTEATFALPIFTWPDSDVVINQMLQWFEQNSKMQRTSVLVAYSLGKAQRILKSLPASSPIYAHGAVRRMNEAYRRIGVELPETLDVLAQPKNHDWSKALVIAPPNALGGAWMKRFKNASIGMASGWMTVRGRRRRRNIDAGFAMSDHADWKSLLLTVERSGAKSVVAVNGYGEALAKYLSKQELESTAWQVATPMEKRS